MSISRHWHLLYSALGKMRQRGIHNTMSRLAAQQTGESSAASSSASFLCNDTPAESACGLPLLADILVKVLID